MLYKHRQIQANMPPLASNLQVFYKSQHLSWNTLPSELIFTWWCKREGTVPSVFQSWFFVIFIKYWRKSETSWNMHFLGKNNIARLIEMKVILLAPELDSSGRTLALELDSTGWTSPQHHRRSLAPPDELPLCRLVEYGPRAPLAALSQHKSAMRLPLGADRRRRAGLACEPRRRAGQPLGGPARADLRRSACSGCRRGVGEDWWERNGGRGRRDGGRTSCVQWSAAGRGR